MKFYCCVGQLWPKPLPPHVVCLDEIATPAVCVYVYVNADLSDAFIQIDIQYKNIYKYNIYVIIIM